jgi:hypothetical protein
MGVKISELPAAPFANALDQLEANQSGVSRRLALSQISDYVGAHLPAQVSLDVRSYGVTMNGITDDTAGVTAAVAAAALTGQSLFWPQGTALTTLSIPLLHTVRHSGPGRIKRGANVFVMAPKAGTTNHLYVAPAGTTANDGLSATEPMASQTAVTALSNYGPVLQATWQIDFAAGANAGFLMALRSVNPVRFVGVPTGDFRTVPTSTITKAASGALSNGMAFVNGANVFVKDILASGFVGLDDAGVWASAYTTITLENNHVTNCYHGWYFLDFVFHSAKGGTISNCTKYGVHELYFVLRNFKYAGSTANGTIITGCEFAVHSKEFCTGHLDFVDISDCTYGAMAVRGSTINSAHASFKRCVIGMVLASRSSAVRNVDTDWHVGTADACTIQILALDPQIIENVPGGGNVEDAILPPYVGQSIKTFGYGIVPFTLTGTTSSTTMINSLGTLQPGEFQAENTQVRLRAFGSASLAAGTGLLLFRVGGVTLGAFTLPIGTLLWEFECHYFVSATGDNQRWFAKLTYTASATSPAVVLINRGTKTNPHSTTAYVFNLNGQLAVGTDSLTADFAEGWTTNR